MRTGYTTKFGNLIRGSRFTCCLVQRLNPKRQRKETRAREKILNLRSDSWIIVDMSDGSSTRFLLCTQECQLRFLTTTKYACYKRANPAFSQERSFKKALSLKNKMFALHHHRMIAPSMPLSDASSDILLRSLPQQKFSPGHVYLRQQHTVQVIELVEGPPPPPRRITSVINDSSVAASSSCDDSSEDSASLSTEEPSCSSYCSSDLPSEHPESPQSHEQTRAESSTETYSVRMKRILAWRENFSSSIGATFSGRSALQYFLRSLADSLRLLEPHLPSSLKRKLACDEEDDDNVSQPRVFTCGDMKY